MNFACYYKLLQKHHHGLIVSTLILFLLQYALINWQLFSEIQKTSFWPLTTLLRIKIIFKRSKVWSTRMILPQKTENLLYFVVTICSKSPTNKKPRSFMIVWLLGTFLSISWPPIRFTYPMFAKNGKARTFNSFYSAEIHKWRHLTISEALG